ncbi:DoxX family protein [Kribbella flavida DSM 17836]|uniref:DoxX family protein n=1 Tax=Kribbella flavida (strain DSM 17836 / JCM 10339 / NBRC 14399) TaxID=479435 RepID=D2Q4Y3_KRIFD|nr:DoxX family protein [Kribbella flavida]ADB34238.1 DoxX family protein [Kribbella flavida DSM 17836]
MTVVRALARPLLSTIFVIQGVNSVRNPEPLVPKAQPVTDRLVPLVKKVAPPQVSDRIPETTVNLVRLNGAVQVLGGLALATGKGRRLGASLLAASLVPSTVAGHPFWQETDKQVKGVQRIQFLKNMSLLGGLLLAAVDTEGQPGLVWRASHGAKAAKRETKRGAKLAKRETKQLARETKQLARSAKREARLATHRAKAELPFS